MVKYFDENNPFKVDQALELKSKKLPTKFKDYEESDYEKPDYDDIQSYRYSTREDRQDKLEEAKSAQQFKKDAKVNMHEEKKAADQSEGKTKQPGVFDEIETIVLGPQGTFNYI